MPKEVKDLPWVAAFLYTVYIVAALFTSIGTLVSTWHRNTLNRTICEGTVSGTHIHIRDFRPYRLHTRATFENKARIVSEIFRKWRSDRWCRWSAYLRISFVTWSVVSFASYNRRYFSTTRQNRGVSVVSIDASFHAPFPHIFLSIHHLLWGKLSATCPTAHTQSTFFFFYFALIITTCIFIIRDYGRSCTAFS